MQNKPRGSSIVIVISPLRSLMEDKVTHLGNIINIKDDEDPELAQQVIV